MLNTSIYGACIYIFCNPLLQNIIQVNCLTLYEYASVKVIKKKKNDPSLDILCRVGGVSYYLNPRFQYRPGVSSDPELLLAVHEVFEKLFATTIGLGNIGNEVHK